MWHYYMLWVQTRIIAYAIGTVAAAAFGAILYTVVTGDSIVSALTNIISRALATRG
jgi:large-conductance mechanosensitive channel